MSKPIAHTRIVEVPDARSLQGGRLDSLRVESVRGRRDLVMDFQGFVPSSPPLMLIQQETLCERLEGHFIPRRLRFLEVVELEQTGQFERLDSLPLTHESRAIRDLFAWMPAGQNLLFFILLHCGTDDTVLRLTAKEICPELRMGEPKPVTLTRDWSAPPSLPPRLIPDTKRIYLQFGGDPISVKLDGQFHHQKLFIGGLDKQGESRPRVDAVLNLGEEPSRWVKSDQLDPRDRWVNKGEGVNGMSIEEITEEALWVIERLKAGERVLIHCVAGMNRSPTICCAALMLLEGLSAEDALERVRCNHPWARPDSNHWLKLRWLASTLK